jgi:hypothetical protein
MPPRALPPFGRPSTSWRNPHAQQFGFPGANLRQAKHQLAGIIRIALLIAFPAGGKQILTRLAMA